jgi:hypothetical protein
MDVYETFLVVAPSNWQFKSQDHAAGSARDLCIVGHIDFVVPPMQGQASSDPPKTILRGVYGLGPLAGKFQVQFHAVEDIDPSEAFKIAAVDVPSLFGSVQRSVFSYLDYTRCSLRQFVSTKAILSGETTADNTMHMNMCGWVFARMVYTYLDMSLCSVSHANGVFFITAPTWEIAQMFLPQGQANGVFDLTADGKVDVELFAPIVFKWEIYDTTRGRGDSRSPDGFVAITFSGYVAVGIKDTREHPDTRSQMFKRPSACPQF